MKKLVRIVPVIVMLFALSACTETKYTKEEKQALIDTGTPLIEDYLKSVPGAVRTTDIDAVVDVIKGRANLTGDVTCCYEIDGLEYVVSINVETGKMLVWDGYREPEDGLDESAETSAVLNPTEIVRDMEPQPEVLYKTPEEQIDLFLEQMDVWYRGGSPEYVPACLYYCVTDLNQNGRLEVISSELHYDTNRNINHFFEINEAGTGIIEMDYDLADADDDMIAPGLVNAELPTLCFFGDGAYHYSLPTQGETDGDHETELFYILSANQQGEISTEILAQKWINHMTDTTTYMRGQEEIEQREYDGADLFRYDGYDLCECGFTWVMLLEGWEKQEIKSQLLDSWEQFAFDILGLYK